MDGLPHTLERKSHLAKMKEVGLFFYSALGHYREVGMLFPSSSHVASKVISLIPVEKMSAIVEIGSGTGRLSQSIFNKMNPQARLICVEKNEAFCKFLHQTLENPRVTVMNASAEDLLKNHPHMANQADCVVLSLPAFLASPSLRNSWIHVCRSLLRTGGHLLTQQFIPVMGHHLPKTQWERTKSRWVADFPPFRLDVYKKLS
jgi:phospholipid N-methyltransferase